MAGIIVISTHEEKGMAKENTSEMIETTICGIPCFVKVETCTIVRPWRGSAYKCPSADDYYGYKEAEFSIYDRKGYLAGWLERKMDGDDIKRIEQMIFDAHEEAHKLDERY